MILNVASKLAAGLIGKDDKKGAAREMIANRAFGLGEEGIPIGREGGPVDYVRWKAAPSETVNDGTVQQAEKDADLRWREFLWIAPASIDECEWEQVRWRFYENGLVCFEARMSNTSGGLDKGDVQGHRVEIREKNGLLIGVWVAAFLVRKDLPMRGFAASFVDDHMPLKLHFSDIRDEQSGAWVCL